jgi:hypothetical protein
MGKNYGTGFETYDLPGELVDIPVHPEQEMTDSEFEEFFENLDWDDVPEIEF